MRNANYIVHQKIALVQMRQAVLLCYLQILRRFLINYATSGIRRTCAYDNLYRKTQETTNYGAFSLTTSYSYNQNGTKKTFTYPNNTTIEGQGDILKLLFGE